MLTCIAEGILATVFYIIFNDKGAILLLQNTDLCS